ncbi:MAG: hypothetical protein HN948_06370 [Clostridia bacterium]|jgi:hypothetical protein|nr:hypothetical protein [Clostridia bacterium]MBT7122621.1 hypothetical protein [Clostridia bacterium]
MTDPHIDYDVYAQMSLGEINISSREKAHLRALASTLAQVAAQPKQEQKRNLWLKHNALEQTRPLVFCLPENAWNEILDESALFCENETARYFETRLTKEILWATEFETDRVAVAQFRVPYIYSRTGWGVKEEIIGQGGNNAYTWNPSIASFDDIHKLRAPKIHVDYIATGRLFDAAQDTFGDILQVTKKGLWWWSLGLTMDLIKFRGLQQFLIDMYDNPDGIHELMAFIRNAKMEMLDFLEQNNLLSLNNDRTHLGIGGHGFSNQLPQNDFAGVVRTADMWGFSESQETVGVSGEMFAEFILPYQIPLAERFGLNAYGCCEPLDNRIEHVLNGIPNLRKVAVSPWSDLKNMAARLQDKYIISYKPNPAMLAVDCLDEKEIRRNLKADMKIARKHNARLEVFMQDTYTLFGNRENLSKWCRIARQVSMGL